jgi:uncharacterized membrane protein
METDKQLLDFLRNHKWAILLAFAGLFFALLAIKYSFLKAIFIFLCIALGLWLGRFIDNKTNVRRSVKDFFNND